MSHLNATELKQAVRTLAVLVRRGYPLSRAVAHISDSHPVWLEIKTAVESGDTAGQALRRYPHVFSNFFAGMIRSAESAPDGEAILSSLAVWLEAAEEARRKVRELLYYPLLLLSLLLMEAAVLVGFALPTSVLPFAFIQSIGGADRYTGIVTSLSVVLMLFAGFVLLASWKTQWALSPAMRIPIFRATVLRADQSLWARAVACYLQGGYSLPEALKACEEVVWSPQLRSELVNLQERVKKGDTLGKAIEGLSLIDPTLRWSITAGESKEDLSGTLFYAAEQLETNLLRQTKAFFIFLQPAAVAVVGLATAAVLGSFWWSFYHYSWNLTL